MAINSNAVNRSLMISNGYLQIYNDANSSSFIPSIVVLTDDANTPPVLGIQAANGNTVLSTINSTGSWIYSSSNLTILPNGVLHVGANTNVNGSANIAGNLVVAGNVTINGSITMGNSSLAVLSIAGNLSVNGVSSFVGNVGINCTPSVHLDVDGSMTTLRQRVNTSVTSGIANGTFGWNANGYYIFYKNNWRQILDLSVF